jgi:hypothetical protein
MNRKTGAARAAPIHYTAPLAWGVLEQFCFDLERITTTGRYPTFSSSAGRPTAQALELLAFMDSKWFDFWVGAVPFPWTRYLTRPIDQYRADLIRMVPGYDDRRRINGKKT